MANFRPAFNLYMDVNIDVQVYNIPRILRREFGCHKRKRWDSLPGLQLRPCNRPLFECTQCRFVNTWGIICLWCRHSCQELNGAAEVCRRTSAPNLLNDAQKEQLHRLEKGKGIPQQISLDIQSATSVRRDIVMDRAGDSIEGASNGSEEYTDPNIDVEDRRRVHRNVAVFSAVDNPGTYLDIHVGQGAGRHSTVVTASQPYTSSIIVSYTDFEHQPIATPNEPPMSPPASPTSSSRTLRRKKHLPVLRKRSCSLREPTNAPILGAPFQLAACKTPSTPSHSSDTLHRTRTSPARRAFSSSPRRPLYASIRPAMAFTTPPPSPPLSPPCIREHLLDEPLWFPRTPFSLTPGSVSGYTELRMGLARRRSDGGDFRFEETGRSGTRKRGRSVSEKVRSFGRGIRALLGRGEKALGVVM